MALQSEELFTAATAKGGDPVILPRTMLVFAHPDDEVIALGGRLGRFGSARFIHVTDGAPRNEGDSAANGFTSWQAYRNARAKEFFRALNAAGLNGVSYQCLGIPDQQASLCLPQLVQQLHEFLQRHRPEVVFTHPYEGGHPDHDACAFAVHRSVALIRQQAQTAPLAVPMPVPLILEAAFYHAGPDGIATGRFLATAQPTLEAVHPLSPEERKRKQALFACFPTQSETLRYFTTDFERFRVAPEYDFEKPPHAAPLFYDGFPWGMNSRRFCELATAADVQTKQELAASCL